MQPVDRGVGTWLVVCCVLLLGLIVLGGVTRLTRSGLSIVRWDPVMGVVPPMGEAAWLEEFEQYRQSPEYRLINKGMSLEQFKGIYWFEYAHRLWGRAIGFVVGLPLLYFLWRRRIDARLALKLGLLVALGGAQGGIGWFMVKSGLVDVPYVAPLRLVLHLGAGVAVTLGLWWVTLQVWWGPSRPKARGSATEKLGWGLMLAAYVVLLTGGLVAGTKAGYAYNTFPLMGGLLFPPDAFTGNILESLAAVQFIHRWLAVLFLLAVVAAAVLVRLAGKDRRVVRWFDGAALVATVQVALGIATLLTNVWVPLGAAHQGVAVLLLGALWAAAMSARRVEQPFAVATGAPSGQPAAELIAGG
jgi:heme a synthase